MAHYHPEDRPDPSEQPIRARVPDHVAAGAFSTGVIVMTAQSEFILDFVQNLGRPHQIIARVVMPHHVLPQLVDALHRNIDLYKNRWGELPQTGQPRPVPHEGNPPATPSSAVNAPASMNATSPAAPSQSSSAPLGGGGAAGGNTGASQSPPSSEFHQKPPSDDAPNPSSGSGQGHAGSRQASVQEIYDDLKIKDEFLSGAYANAVMIGHGPHEFSFDFITNFYPHSAVSARVFLAAGQIPRLFESLKGTWEQLRSRMQPPPDQPNNENPFA